MIGRPERSAPLTAPVPPRSAPASDGEVTVDYSDGQWAPDESHPLAVGARVGHPVFGTGTIAEVIGSGRNGKIRIRFDRAGIKTIVIRYAQLRLLE